MKIEDNTQPVAKLTRSLLIAVEGADGVGKQTTTEELANKLRTVGYPVIVVSCPDYDSTTGDTLRRYLRGELSDGRVSPYLIAPLYELNRLEIQKSIQSYLNGRYLILCDRWTLSNAAYQGATIAEEADRRAFYQYLFLLQDELGLRQPDITLYLDVDPSEVTYNREKDMHESDFMFQVAVQRCYAELLLDVNTHTLRRPAHVDKATSIDTIAEQAAFLVMQDIDLL